MNNVRRKKLEKAHEYLYDAFYYRADIEKAKDLADKAADIIEDVQSEEQDAFDNLPEGLQSSTRGEEMEDNICRMEDALEEIGKLDFTKEERDIDEDINTIVEYVTF